MKAKRVADATFKFRCYRADLSVFRRAAKAGGFGDNLTAWILFCLRREASGQVTRK